jgi:hypothetical protein
MRAIIAAQSRWPSRVRANVATCARALHGCWNSGRPVTISNTRAADRFDHGVEQLVRRRVNPVRILDQEQHRLRRSG